MFMDAKAASEGNAIANKPSVTNCAAEGGSGGTEVVLFSCSQL
jgi:hypothetical protein